MVKRMSKEEFKRFLDAVLSDDKGSEIVISFKYDNSIKFRWAPRKVKGGKFCAVRVIPFNAETMRQCRARSISKRLCGRSNFWELKKLCQSSPFLDKLESFSGRCIFG